MKKSHQSKICPNCVPSVHNNVSAVSHIYKASAHGPRSLLLVTLCDIMNIVNFAIKSSLR